MEQAARGVAAVEGSRVEALTVEVAVAPSLVVLEPVFLLVAVALAGCWAESGFSPPWGAAGQAAGKACSVSTQGCRLS